MTTQTSDAPLTVPEVINFGEEDVVLDFEQIKKLTLDAKKKAAESRKVIPKEKIVLTDEENKQVIKWTKELEKYVQQWATKGEDKFLYDCSKIPFYLFKEIAQCFKEKNPKFYVETHDGTQMIVVMWHGKNEV